MEQKPITYQDLKQIYEQSSPQCQTRGMIFTPMHTEQMIIRKNAIWIPYTEYTYHPYPNTEITVKNHPKKIEYPFETEQRTKPDQLHPAPCKKISCERCRSQIIKQRHDTIVQLTQQYGLKIHEILTFPGIELRRKYSLPKAYEVFKHEKWKLDKRIDYTLQRIHQGKEIRSKNPLLKEKTVKRYKNTTITTTHVLPQQFLQISLLRAQSGKHKYAQDEYQEQLLGYPHYHNLTNLNINTEWITEVSQKNEFKIGFSFVRENQSIEDYLANDFYYQDEWYIPFHNRHISTSRGIILTIPTQPLDNTQYFNTQYLDFIENSLSQKGYHVPLENYMQKFSTLNKRR